MTEKIKTAIVLYKRDCRDATREELKAIGLTDASMEYVKDEVLNILAAAFVQAYEEGLLK